jgi:hypothetical protein
VERKDIISALVELGKILQYVANENQDAEKPVSIEKSTLDQLVLAIQKEKQFNPWFTLGNCRQALQGIAQLLQESTLTNFVKSYSVAEKPKTVALIMAGNIPLVGFHDLMCVLLSGNRALCKLSSTDARLPLEVVYILNELNAEFEELIHVSVGPISGFDAVIATGSNNSIVQLAHYFSAVPHLFRQNRTSIAVLDGSETDEELVGLASDCMSYFGMGCRNVSKLFIPANFELNRFFEALVTKGDIINHHKYGNNYDYHRTVFLMNNIAFLDNNCVMLKEDEGLHAPLSVIYFQRYESQTEIDRFMEVHADEIQAVVGHQHISFGKAQSPRISDFADNVDTMKWLNQLS